MPRKTYQDNTVRGRDVYGASFSLPPGYFVDLNNLIPYGTGGAQLREGFQGQLSTLRTGPLWFPMERAVQMPSGTASRIVFASNGKLYWSAEGSTSSTEILDTASASLALADGGEHCQIVQDGKFLYGIEGGSSGRLFSIDTDAGTWVVTYLVSMKVPTYESGPTLLTDPLSTDATEMNGTYQYRVRPMKSVAASYPPTGTGAKIGKALEMGDINVPNSTPSTSTVRGEYVTGVQILWTDNGTLDGLTHYVIERKGGIASIDQEWHIVAVVPYNSNDSLSISAGRGYTYNATTAAPTRSFSDYMWDEDVDTGATVIDGEDLPLGCDCIATHAGCLWAADDTTVYKSRLLTSEFTSIEFGLFWDLVPDLDAANVAILGASFTLGAEGGTRDRIKYLASVPSPDAQNTFGSILFAFREHSITPIKGTTALDIVAGPTLDAVGRGLISRRGITYADGAWWYNSSEGPMMFDSRQPQPVAIKLDGLVTSKGLGNATGTSRVALCWYDFGLWAFFPVASGTNNTICHLWRKTEQDWCQLTQTVVSGFTGANVMVGASDTGKLYLAGRDGQLYVYGGTTDKATPSGANVSIPWGFTSRAYGLSAEAGGRARYAYQSPRVLYLYIDGSVASTINWTITSSTTVTDTGTYSLAAGPYPVEIASISDIQGNWHQVSVSGSIQGTLRFGSLALEVIEETTVR